MQTTRRTAMLSALGLVMSSVMGRAAEIHWTYEGEEGPENWAELTDDFKVCSFGRQQSPIDLTQAVASDLGDIDLQWNTAANWDIANNGHTIQANSVDAGHAVIEGKRFDLKQFHFHSPSEHALDGKRFDMELHLVHQAEDKALAVIGVMMMGGGSNALFKSVMDVAPKDKGSNPLGAADPRGMMPASTGVLRYQGSLTTPPCSETVLWTVMQEPLQVSDETIAAFTGIYDGNARPLQDTNRRFILSEG